MSTPSGLHKAFVFQNNELRHFAHRVCRRVGSLHCAARGAIGFLRSLRSATELSGTDDRRDKKKQAYGSLSSPACSCVAINCLLHRVGLAESVHQYQKAPTRRHSKLPLSTLGEYLSNRLRFRAFRCGTVRNRRLVNLPDFSLANWLFRGADDGIRTHTSLFARTDFKSVASAISPHRRCENHLSCVLLPDQSRFDGNYLCKAMSKTPGRKRFSCPEFMFAAKRSPACGFWLVPRAPLLFGKSSTRRRARNTPRKATTKKTFRRRSPILTRQHLAA